MIVLAIYLCDEKLYRAIYRRKRGPTGDGLITDGARDEIVLLTQTNPMT